MPGQDFGKDNFVALFQSFHQLDMLFDGKIPVGPGFVVGAGLVADRRIKAVGFTGSRAGGLALMRIARERPEPIPVYAEMSSVNPVVLLPAGWRHGPRTSAPGSSPRSQWGQDSSAQIPGLCSR